ncbi:MAG: fused MFS/spermidine synthase [Acidobacteriota bacterium]|nr:fused MFS/spermidine synthase [Acidobacteriota bacterium]
MESTQTAPPAATSASSSRLFPVLLVLFAASGAAALIYEIVWLQLLELVIGSSAVSLAVLLGTWMGGMFLGSVLFARVAPRNQNPLKVYALLEAGTAAFGILVLFGLPLVQRVYLAGVSSGLPSMLLRGFACVICLLPPTVLMGATLPAISRWVKASPEASAWWGYLYASNIAGGVAGCFAAGFYLLRVYDMTIASLIAASLNLAVAGISAAIGGREEAEESQPAETETEPPEGVRAVYFAIAVSGFCALGAEVVWTRILSLILGPTVYTFSIILGVFLTGLGLGSWGGSNLARKKGNPRVWLGMSQVLLCVTTALSAYLLADYLPYWTGNVDSTAGPWKDFQGDILRSIFAVLPGAVLWGASFPLALAGAAAGDEDPAQVVGRIYGANTIGAILGSLIVSLLVIPHFGTLGAQQWLIVFSAIGGVAVLEGAVQKPMLKLSAAIAAAGLLAWMIPPIPWMLIGFGRRLPSTTGHWDLLREEEGMNSSAAWSRWEGGTVYFHVSGKVEASTEPQDMSLQRMLGHLPALLSPHPGSILIVGFGAGVTAGTFVIHPGVKHINICEIEPAIPPNSDRYFGPQNYHVLHDPRTRITYDDARHFVLTSNDKYDIITSDPIHPWVKGMASLYTTEYFEMCKRHLNPGGFVTQWVPLYETSVEAARTEIATFFAAFPNGTIWGNVNTDGTGYDLVLMGQVEPLKIDLDALQKKLTSPSYDSVRSSLRDAGYNSGIDLLSTYAAQASDLREWIRGAQINRDRNLRLQYLAGLGVNSNLADDIYNQMLSPAKFPDNVFTGAPDAVATMRSMFHRSRY